MMTNTLFRLVVETLIWIISQIIYHLIKDFVQHVFLGIAPRAAGRSFLLLYFINAVHQLLDFFIRTGFLGVSQFLPQRVALALDRLEFGVFFFFNPVQLVKGTIFAHFFAPLARQWKLACKMLNNRYYSTF